MAEPRAIEMDALRPRLERAFDFAAAQVRATIEKYPDYFPIYTTNGRWKHDGELWTDWCAGFHAGMMWLIARRTGDAWWRAAAEHYTSRLEHKKTDRDVHDLGFIFLNTYLPWYEETGDAKLHAVLIEAGRTLALRFQPKGRYLRSFVAPESLFIDIMMNVPLIFYAARETGDKALYDLAVAHCRTTERYLVRPNGGTAHEGLFDLETGAFTRQSTHQGLAAGSDWSRGLAWSLYGFGTVFGYTQDAADLAVAENNANHFIDRCPATMIPPWDFDVPAGPDRIDDSSAAAIAASGLWNLARLSPDISRSLRYRHAALTALDSLLTDRYMAWNTPGWEGVLKHGVYHFHKKLGVDESVMWGEYFFLEAVTKALGGVLMESDLPILEPDVDDPIADEPRTVLITGACGNIGRKLRAAWDDVYDLVLIDQKPDPDDPNLIVADLADPSPDWMECFHGADVVVHLAGNPNEFAAWEELYRPNIDAFANVLNAAVLAGVERVVFASSNHAMGGYRALPVGSITVDLPPWPDGPYGGTKLMGERLGRAAAAAYEISFVALRIGWVNKGDNRPDSLPDDWAMKLWLSNNDLIRLFDRAVEADLGADAFVVVNGLSNNRGTRWDLSHSREALGFEPVDDAFAED